MKQSAKTMRRAACAAALTAALALSLSGCCWEDWFEAASSVPGGGG